MPEKTGEITQKVTDFGEKGLEHLASALSHSPLSFGRFDGLANWSGLRSALPMTQGYPLELHGLSKLLAVHDDKGEEDLVRPEIFAIRLKPKSGPRTEAEIQLISCDRPTVEVWGRTLDRSLESILLTPSLY